jgi:hypothetical protein
VLGELFGVPEFVAHERLDDFSRRRRRAQGGVSSGFKRLANQT